MGTLARHWFARVEHVRTLAAERCARAPLAHKHTMETEGHTQRRRERERERERRIMLVAGCLACDVIAGRVVSPGGTIYNGEHWRVTHSVSPVLLPGFLILAPKRHCEHLALLDSQQMREFGPLLR